MHPILGTGPVHARTGIPALIALMLSTGVAPAQKYEGDVGKLYQWACEQGHRNTLVGRVIKGLGLGESAVPVWRQAWQDDETRFTYAVDLFSLDAGVRMIVFQIDGDKNWRKFWLISSDGTIVRAAEESPTVKMHQVAPKLYFKDYVDTKNYLLNTMDMKAEPLTGHCLPILPP